MLDLLLKHDFHFVEVCLSCKNVLSTKTPRPVLAHDSMLGRNILLVITAEYPLSKDAVIVQVPNDLSYKGQIHVAQPC